QTQPPGASEESPPPSGEGPARRGPGSTGGQGAGDALPGRPGVPPAAISARERTGQEAVRAGAASGGVGTPTEIRPSGPEGGPGPGSNQGSQAGSGPGRAESGRQPDQGGGSGGPAPERPAQFRHVDRPVRRRGHQTLGGPRGHRQGSIGPPLTVTRTDVVRILLDIPERDVPLVNATEQNPNKDGKGDLVTLHIPALRSVVSNGEFTGHITRLASAL